MSAPASSCSPQLDQSRALAAFAAARPLEGLPSSGSARLKECLLDFVGVAAFAAAATESSPAFRKAVAALAGPAGDATVIGDDRRYPLHYAALLNGAYAHTLDFDDTNQEGVLHPGVAVIPAAMAQAESLDCDGRSFIDALAVGYEVACRVGAALGASAYDRGFHVTSVAGLFGAIAAIANLRAADAPTIANAFGIAVSRAGGMMQCLFNGAWNKRLHPGFASHDAFLCMALAEAGVPGAAQPIEGRFGLLAGFSNSPRPEALTQQLGERWLLEGTAFKPYPSCRMTHAAIDAVLQLRETLSAADRERARFTVHLSPTALQVVGEPLPSKLHPAGIVEGQFSVYFQVAVAWLDGRCDWSSYRRLGAPDVAACIERIRTQADATLPMAGAEVTLELDGKNTCLRVPRAVGEPDRPLSWEQLERKFRSLAETVYGEPHCDRLAARIRRLEEERSMKQLIGELKARSATGARRLPVDAKG